MCPQKNLGSENNTKGKRATVFSQSKLNNNLTKNYVIQGCLLFPRLDLELDADGPQCGNAPQAVRRSINLNLTKKSRMRTKSSSNKTSKSSRRDRKSERDGDGGIGSI